MEIHLASMENVTCWAFRKLCKGATDSCTGMMSANYLIRRSKAWKEVDMFPIDGQRQWLQIATSKEKECSELLARLERELSTFPQKNSLYGIQLNASCPSPEVVNLGQGGALMKRPKKIISLIQELLKPQDLLALTNLDGAQEPKHIQGFLTPHKFKVSLKIRLGFNIFEAKKSILVLLEELQKIKDPNFSHVVIHFKYASEQSFTPYNYSILNEICQFKVPLIINGGINNYNDFKKIISSIPKNNNIKGFMIGREAINNPDCFASILNSMHNITKPLRLRRALGDPGEIDKTNSSLKAGDFSRGLNNPVRTPDKILSEFKELCEQHPPKDIYLKKIAEFAPWAKR